MSNISPPPPLNPPVSVTLQPYTVQFTIQNLNDSTTIVYDVNSFNNFTTLREASFNLNGLTESTPYTISCTLVDPANKTVVVEFNSGSTIRTREVNAPVLINDESVSVNTVEGELSVSLSNVGAYDTQSAFDIYVGLTTITDMSNLSTNALSNLQSTNAVKASVNNPASSVPVLYHPTGLTQFIDTDGINIYTSPLDFDVEYNIVAATKDAYGNVAYENSVIIGSVTLLRVVEENVEETVVEITPEDSADVGQETVTDSSLNLNFQEITT